MPVRRASTASPRTAATRRPPRRRPRARRPRPMTTEANRSRPAGTAGRARADGVPQGTTSRRAADAAAVATTLDAEERRRIGIRLGAGLVAIGLLGLGTLLIALAPDQW